MSIDNITGTVLRNIFDEVSKEYKLQTIGGYKEWQGGTAPEKPDIVGVYFEGRGPVKKLYVLVGPFRNDELRTGVELPISEQKDFLGLCGWAAYRIFQTVDGVVIDVLETNHFRAQPTLHDSMENTLRGRRIDYRDGQLEILLSLANNDMIRGRPVTPSEATSLIEALKKRLSH